MSWPIGKMYDGGTITVEAAHTQAYARATNDENPAYFGPDAIAPPLFHVRLLKDVMFQVACDPELKLNMVKLVHGEHKATFHAPLRPGDVATMSARLENVEQKASGLLVESRHFVRVGDALAVEATTAYFIRGQGVDADAPKPARAPREPAPEPPAPDFVVPLPVTGDQSHRYATVSLDDNPIHTDPAFAAKAGLPDVILHGLCTMAMAGRVLVDDQAGGNPLRLRHLGVRFAGMVFNGEDLQTVGWRTGEDIQFAVLNGKGKPVIANGTARIA
jgi:acyl dehydratase